MADELFTFERRVAFGECDPARIFFAPRATDYAVEAVEAWFDAVVGVSWTDLVMRHGLEARFTRLECEYRRPLTAGQVIRVRVSVQEVDDASFTLGAAAELGPGVLAFQVRCVMSFVARADGNVVPIPAAYGERMEAYRLRCADGAAAGAGTAWSEPVPKRDEAYLSSLRRKAAAPFVRQRRVLYGECAVGGTMYLPKLVECAIERLGEWYEWCLGISWLEQNIRKRGVPFLNIQCECLRPMVPGQVITMVVRIPRLGNASIGYEVIGYDDRGEPCFHTQVAACYISEESGAYEPIPFPDELRARIRAYQNECERSESGTAGAAYHEAE
jgi:acyl-CoA thioesterase FadM